MPKSKNTILLIVESPAKAKTIKKYLGSGYTIGASMGHLIDLPKSRLAVDVDNGFTPEYITVRGKAKILRELIQKAKRAEKVQLASDNDREGEAIAFHIKTALAKKIPGLKFERIVFNEITPLAIKQAVKEPRDIDNKKVEAQKARRILDRLVGYHLSPILWEKVKNGLSAGRVQSVALKMICEREQEVEAFIPEKYWTLEAELCKGKRTFRANLIKYCGEKAALKSEQAVNNIVKEIEGLDLTVIDVKKTEKSNKPRAPYTTSKLQQEAANRLGFTSRKTMQIAQQLYEGIDIENERAGLITYMRTDSTRIAESALQSARAFIARHYARQLPDKAQYYAQAKGAQDAHEAIRPTFVQKTPELIRQYLSKDQYKLYAIIWERFVSSQMKATRILTTSVDFRVKKAIFRTTATSLLEPGFQKVLKVLAGKKKQIKMPKLQVGDKLNCLGYFPEQHFTSGPARFTDASIVKALEEKGIGRPSTYAPIISVLINRYYVVRKARNLVPTTLGRIINDILIKSFPDVLSVDFTARVEKKLDSVENIGRQWVEMLREFYDPFKKQVEHVIQTLDSIKGIMDEPTEYTCDKCGKQMIKKLGKYGFFLACSGFPQCMSTKPLPLASCPRPGCNGKIIERRKYGKKRGKSFYGCTNYPGCDFITHLKPLDQKCPKCGNFLVQKYNKKRGSFKACINTDCDYIFIEENNKSNG